MKHRAYLGACLGACFFLVAAAVFADGAAVQAIDFHNVHIRVSDPAKAGEWYVKYLGATAGRAPQLIYFGKTLIEFVKTDNAQPSAGSVIDHIGLSYADLRAKMKDSEAGGAKIVTPVRDAPGLSLAKIGSGQILRHCQDVCALL